MAEYLIPLLQQERLWTLMHDAYDGAAPSMMELVAFGTHQGPRAWRWYLA